MSIILCTNLKFTRYAQTPYLHILSRYYIPIPCLSTIPPYFVTELYSHIQSKHNTPIFCHSTISAYFVQTLYPQYIVTVLYPHFYLNTIPTHFHLVQILYVNILSQHNASIFCPGTIYSSFIETLYSRMFSRYQIPLYKPTILFYPVQPCSHVSIFCPVHMSVNIFYPVFKSACFIQYLGYLILSSLTITVMETFHTVTDNLSLVFKNEVFLQHFTKPCYSIQYLFGDAVQWLFQQWEKRH